MLELENLNAGYGPSQVLFNLSMTVQEKEIVSIIGRNGVGKTSTLKAVMGLINVVSGSIRFDSREISEAAHLQTGASGNRLCSRRPGNLCEHHHSGKSADSVDRPQDEGEGSSRPRLFALSHSERAMEPEGGDAERRRAADAHDCEGPCGQAEAADAGRDLGGIGPGGDHELLLRLSET